MSIVVHGSHAFCTTTRSLIELHGERLSSLIGRTIDAGWVAWDLDADSGFDSEFVVLHIGGTNLELLHSKISMLAIGYDSIDLKSPPSRGPWAERKFRLAWRKDGHPAIAAAIGRTIARIVVVEYRARFWSEDAPDGPPHYSWVLSGLGFDLAGGGYFEVANGIDKNELVAERPAGEDFRFTTVATSERS